MKGKSNNWQSLTIVSRMRMPSSKTIRLIFRNSLKNCRSAIQNWGRSTIVLSERWPTSTMCLLNRTLSWRKWTPTKTRRAFQLWLPHMKTAKSHTARIFHARKNFYVLYVPPVNLCKAILLNSAGRDSWLMTWTTPSELNSPNIVNLTQPC